MFLLFQDVENIKKELSKAVNKKELVALKNMSDVIEKLSTISTDGKSKYNVSQYNISTREIMEKELYDLVGDEYEIIGDYKDRVTKIQLRHRKCGRSFYMKPMTFLDGGRCHFCNRMITEDAFELLIKELTKGRYILRGRATKNLYIIHDTYSSKDILLTKQKTLQELNRKSNSDMLPLETRVDTEQTLILTKADLVYDYICRNYQVEEPVFLEDITVEGITYVELKGQMKNLVQSSKLERISPGIYSFPKASITQEELLKNRYLVRNGRHIGFYYGKTFGAQLGLCEETDIKYIATNKESQKHGRKKEIYGEQVRIKGTVTEVTDENYRILAMLDFITCFNTYTKEGKERVQLKIKEYVKEYGIEEEAVQKYIDLFPVWTRYFMDKIFDEE